MEEQTGYTYIHTYKALNEASNCQGSRVYAPWAQVDYQPFLPAVASQGHELSVWGVEPSQLCP